MTLSQPLQDGDFRVITYSEIDLEQTKILLKSQGILKVDLGWWRARTMIALLNQERKLNLRVHTKFARLGRIVSTLLDITYLFPLALLSSKLVELFCIYVNHCHHAEWETLPNGKYRFTIL